MTTSRDIADRLTAVIAQTFDLPPSAAGGDAQLGRTPRWDSLGHLELMLAIEAEFDVTIRSDQIRSLTSFALLRALLEEQVSR